MSVHCTPKAQPTRIVHPWRRRSATVAGVYRHCPRSSAHHPRARKKTPRYGEKPSERQAHMRPPLPLWLSFGSTQRGVSDPAAWGEALIRHLLSRPLASLDVSGQRRLFVCTPRLTRCGYRSRRQHTAREIGSQWAIRTNMGAARKRAGQTPAGVPGLPPRRLWRGGRLECATGPGGACHNRLARPLRRDPGPKAPESIRGVWCETSPPRILTGGARHNCHAASVRAPFRKGRQTVRLHKGESTRPPAHLPSRDP